MTDSILPRIHIITDTVIQNRFSHKELAEIAFRSGIKTVQFREKRNSFLNSNEISDCIRSANEFGGKLIINDYSDEAFSLNAHGVHVGQEDPLPEMIHQHTNFHSRFVLGVTIHDALEYEKISECDFISYIGVGPVFGTMSKNTSLPALGLEGLKKIVELSRFPVIAIGNINADNIESVWDAGAYGAAVLGYFCNSIHPEHCAENLLNKEDAFFGRTS